MTELNLNNYTPEIRYLNDMREVIFDTDWLKQQNNNPALYYMYRNLKRDDNLRYDITITSPFLWAKNLLKL